MEDINDQRDENSFTVNLFLLWDLVSDVVSHPMQSPSAASTQWRKSLCGKGLRPRPAPRLAVTPLIPTTYDDAPLKTPCQKTFRKFA